jgi:hypothetical protein
MGVKVKKQKTVNKIGRTLRIVKDHDKDVLSIRVKRDMPHLVKLHLVARRASIDKDRPEAVIHHHTAT